MVRALDRQGKRGHVLQRLAEQAVEFLVAGLDLGYGFKPLRHRLRVVRLVALPNAILWRVEMFLAILQRVEQATMPSLAWPKRDLEAEASVGRDSFARSARHRCCHGAVKILVRIGGAEPLPPLRPFRRHLAPPYNLT